MTRALPRQATRSAPPGRGIGPTYADKVNRIGIRVQDLFDEKILRQKLEAALDDKNHPASRSTTGARSPSTRSPRSCLGYADRLAPLRRRHLAGAQPARSTRARSSCFEGAQGTLLDVDHGTYPFVTSSNPTAGGACTGRGHRPDPDRPGDRHPQGLHDPRRLRSVPDRAARRGRRVPAHASAASVGVTTGRDRRCGWFDAVIARYATRVNGLTDFFLTKLDVLTGWERIPVCVAYDDRRRPARRDAHTARPTSTTPSRCTSTCPAGPRTSPGPHVRRPAEERAGLRAGAGGDVRRTRSPRSASAPAATRPSRSTPSSDRSRHDAGRRGLLGRGFGGPGGIPDGPPGHGHCRPPGRDGRSRRPVLGGSGRHLRRSFGQDHRNPG